MEVRSNEEKNVKVASDVMVAAAATTTATINSSMEPKATGGGTDVTVAATAGLIMKKQSKTTVNNDSMTMTALTKDERLVAELKSQMPDINRIFTIHRRIGEGTFSTVFLTSLRCQEHVRPKKRRLFALKYLIKTSHPIRVAQELRCLKEIGGKENVIGVDLCLRNNDAIAFVMPYIPHDHFQNYFTMLTSSELQQYMRNLFIALKHVHDFGVIHRDVKPSNFLYDRKNRKYLLVDFGLAQTLDKKFDSTKSIVSKPYDRNNDETTANNGSNTGGSYESDKNYRKQPQQQQLNNKASHCVANEAESIYLMDNANRNKRKSASDEVTENKCSNTVAAKRVGDGDAMEVDVVEIAANQPKRVRNTLPIGSLMLNNFDEKEENDKGDEKKPQQQHQFSHQEHTRLPYIPSQFKAPLNQINEISTPKDSNRNGISALNSPLTADIKSAIVGYSINAKIWNQQRNNNNSMLPNIPKLPTRASTFKTNSVNALTNDLINKTPNMPCAQKYNVDNRRSSNSDAGVKCYCYARPSVCNLCLVKRKILATRAGTPGYRATEVLLKYPNQTTAVDVWAAGVILISILSGCYPFFKSTDDFTALAEIITVFGDAIVKKVALSLDRHVCVGRKKRPLHLRKLCLRLRNRFKMQNTPYEDHISNSTQQIENCENCEQMMDDCLCADTDYNMKFTGDIYPESVYDLLAKLLAIGPNNRISAKDALQHPFFKEIH